MLISLRVHSRLLLYNNQLPVQDHRISIQKQPTVSAASIQYPLVFGTARWANFDELLVAFTCVYHGSRLRDAISATLGSPFLDNMCENVREIHQDYMRMLKKHATMSVTCKRTSTEPKVYISQLWKTLTCMKVVLKLIQHPCRCSCTPLFPHLHGRQLVAMVVRSFCLNRA